MPTATIATRLGLPVRTARYRLARLRQAGIVITGADGLYRVAEGLPPDRPAGAPDLPAWGALAAGPRPARATASTGDGKDTDGLRSVRGRIGGYRAALAVLAATGIGVAAVTLLRRPQDPPSSPMEDGGGWPANWQ